MTTITKNLELYFMHAPINGLTALQAIDTSSIVDGLFIVVSGVGIFQLQVPAVLTPDGIDVIQPNVGDGVWIRQSLNFLKTSNGKIDSSMVDMALQNLSNVTISSLQTNQILKYNGTAWVNANITNAPEALSNLTDVTISNPADKQALIYNELSAVWNNETLTIPTTLDSLDDVEITDVQNNQVVTWSSADAKWINEDQQVPVLSFEDLTDVTVVNVQNNQVPTWNSTSSKWENLDTQRVPTGLTNLTDTNIATPANGQSLAYDGTNSEWVNVDTSSIVDHNSTNGVQGGITDEYYHLNNSDYTFLNGTDQELKTTSDVEFKSASISSDDSILSIASVENNNALNNASALKVSNIGTGATISATNTGTELQGTAHSKAIKTNAGMLEVPSGSSVKLATFGCSSPDADIGFSAEIVRNSAYGSVTSAAVNNSGSGYEQYDWALVNNGNANCQLSLTDVNLGVINDVSIISAGSEYITGGYTLQNTPATNGFGCTVDITTSLGVILTATVNQGGSGYNVNDKITITPSVPLSLNCQLLVDSIGINGSVVSLSIYKGGSGYTDSTANPTFGYTGIGSSATVDIVASTGTDDVSVSWGLDQGNTPNKGARNLLLNSNGTSTFKGALKIEGELSVYGDIYGIMRGDCGMGVVNDPTTSANGTLNTVLDNIYNAIPTPSGYVTTSQLNQVCSAYEGIYVDSVNGNDSTGTGTPSSPFKTMQACLNSFSAGSPHVMYVKGSTTGALTFRSGDQSLRIIFDPKSQHTGTITLVSGNTSIYFDSMNSSAMITTTINDDSHGNIYWNCDMNSSVYNKTGGSGSQLPTGYVQFSEFSVIDGLVINLSGNTTLRTLGTGSAGLLTQSNGVCTIQHSGSVICPTISGGANPLLGVPVCLLQGNLQLVASSTNSLVCRATYGLVYLVGITTLQADTVTYGKINFTGAGANVICNIWVHNQLAPSGDVLPTLTSNVNSANYLNASYTPTNYTATSTSVKGNLQGIDNALASAGGNSYSKITVLYPLTKTTATFLTLQAAFDSIPSGTDNTNIRQVYTVYIPSGTYDEDVSIQINNKRINIVCLGTVNLGALSGSSWGAGGTTRNLTITNNGTSTINSIRSAICITSQSNNTDKYTTHQSYLNGLRVSGNMILTVTGTAISSEFYIEAEVFGNFDTSTYAGNCNVYCKNSRFRGTFGSSACRLQHADNVRFDGLITSAVPTFMLNSQVNAGMTVISATPDNIPTGFVNTYFAGTFTGPASSFLTDNITYYWFVTNAATLAGGATIVYQEKTSALGTSVTTTTFNNFFTSSDSNVQQCLNDIDANILANTLSPYKSTMTYNYGYMIRGDGTNGKTGCIFSCNANSITGAFNIANWNIVIGSQDQLSGYNTWAGKGALSSLTTTTSTAFGYQAGAVATGSSNTFIGYRTGVSAGSGNNNTMIGANATLTNVTDSNYVVVSDGAGVPVIKQGTAGAQLPANKVMATPNASTGACSVRSLVSTDLATGGTSSNYLRGDMTWASVGGGGGSLPISYNALTDTPALSSIAAGQIYQVTNSGAVTYNITGARKSSGSYLCIGDLVIASYAGATNPYELLSPDIVYGGSINYANFASIADMLTYINQRRLCQTTTLSLSSTESAETTDLLFNHPDGKNLVIDATNGRVTLGTHTATITSDQITLKSIVFSSNSTLPTMTIKNANVNIQGTVKFDNGSTGAVLVGMNGSIKGRPAYSAGSFSYNGSDYLVTSGVGINQIVITGSSFDVFVDGWGNEFNGVFGPFENSTVRINTANGGNYSTFNAGINNTYYVNMAYFTSTISGGINNVFYTQSWEPTNPNTTFTAGVNSVWANTTLLSTNYDYDTGNMSNGTRLALNGNANAPTGTPAIGTSTAITSRSS